MKKLIVPFIITITTTIFSQNKFPTFGNVGIGTTNPRGKLEVYIENSYSNKEIYFTSQENGQNQNSNSPRLNLVGAFQRAGFGIQAINVNGHGRKDLVFYAHNSNDYKTYQEVVRFKYTGRVGIGTSNPDAKLSVNGNIHTKEVKVDLSGWPDYVFNKNYNLPSLEEVESHIKEKGHLSNIPTAAEVAKNGVQLGEMNKKLLQKIEELTLYTIEQQKQLKSQEKKLRLSEQKNTDLEARLSKIEQLLQTHTKN